MNSVSILCRYSMNDVESTTSPLRLIKPPVPFGELCSMRWDDWITTGANRDAAPSDRWKFFSFRMLVGTPVLLQWHDEILGLHEAVVQKKSIL